MDPLTLLALAQTAYSTIKTAVATGKEIQGMIGDISSLMESVAGLTLLSAEGPKKNLFGGTSQSAEKEAMDAYQAKQKANEMMQEIQNLFVAQYGYQEWMRLQSEITRIKKERKRAAEEAAKSRQKMWDAIGLWGSILLIIIVFSIAIGAAAYLYTLSH